MAVTPKNVWIKKNRVVIFRELFQRYCLPEHLNVLFLDRAPSSRCELRDKTHNEKNHIPVLPLLAWKCLLNTGKNTPKLSMYPNIMPRMMVHTIQTNHAHGPSRGWGLLFLLHMAIILLKYIQSFTGWCNFSVDSRPRRGGGRRGGDLGMLVGIFQKYPIKITDVISWHH